MLHVMRKGGNGRRQTDIPATKTGEEPERRRSPRQPIAQPISLHRHGQTRTADVIDISATGAQLHIRQGLLPRPGEGISLTLLDGTEIVCLVRWVCRGRLGVQFSTRLDEAVLRASLDHLGSRLFQRLALLQHNRKTPADE